MIGQTISHYKILEKLGEGGMGVVYKAEDTKLKRAVALKFLPQELTRDEDAKKRFVREAQAASALQHNNICTIHEIDETGDGQMFICMDYYEGETLKEKIGRGPLPIAEALDVARRIGGGLAKAHGGGMVHRDIKPANVMVTSEGVVKIVDFGLAKLAGRTKVTKTGTTAGTVAYMSPEQARGEGVDHRTDIWSLGVIIYEMLTGQSPFRGDHEQAVTYNIIHEDAEPITAVRTGVPMELERIVDKCLEKKPSDRYQHVDELVVDLRKVKRAATPGPKKNLIKYAIPGVVVFVAVALFFILNPFHIEFKKDQPVAAAENTIGVIGFENLSDPEDKEHLGRMLMGLISTDLTESGGLNVVSTSKVLAAYKEAGGRVEGGFDASLAVKTARYAGVATMFTGQMIQSGETLLLTAELVDVESGRTVGSRRREAASSPELFALAGAMASDVRGYLGARVKTPAGGAFDLAQALTDSPAAYRQFAAGELALHQRASEAVEHFRLAVKQDSAFAMAWYRLAMALEWQGDTEGALAASTRSLEYVERLPERWQIMCKAQNDYGQGNVDAAYDGLMRLIGTAPDLPDAYNLLGEIVTHFSRYLDLHKARSYFEKALEIDPTFKVVFHHLLEDYLALGDVEAAERLVARYRKDDPLDGSLPNAEHKILYHQQRYDGPTSWLEAQMQEENLSWNVAAAILAYRGEFERAFTLADDATRTTVGAGRAHTLWLRGEFHCARGRFGAALADYRDAAAWVVSLGRGASALAGTATRAHLSRAHVLWLTGDIKGALAAVRDAARNDRFHPQPYFWSGYFSLGAGRRGEADDALQNLKAMAKEGFSPWPEWCRHILMAEVHRDNGDLDQALAELRKASELRLEELGTLGGMEYVVRARVLEARGDRGGAIAAYLHLLKPSTVWWQWLGSPRIIPVHYELGRLLEQEGDLAAAREHYQMYVDCWGNADMPVPNVETAKVRLKALESGQ